MSEKPESTRQRVVTTAVRGVIVVAVVALIVSSLTGTVLAGDLVAFFTASPDELEAEPGEAVEVDVWLQSQGGHGGVGVQSVTMQAAYDADALAVVDVEPAGWLEGENVTVETETTIDDDDGVTVLEQSRDPAAGGATGQEVFATLTVEVTEDTSAENATIGFRESEVTLTNELPKPIRDYPATVAIDAGAADSDEPIPGITHLAGGLAVLAVAVAVARRQRR